MLVVEHEPRPVSATFRWSPKRPDELGWSLDQEVVDRVSLCLDCRHAVGFIGTDGVLSVDVATAAGTERALSVLIRDGFVIDASSPIERADEIRIRRETGIAIGCDFRGGSWRREVAFPRVDWGDPMARPTESRSRWWWAALVAPAVGGFVAIWLSYRSLSR